MRQPGEIDYTPTERGWLAALGVFGFPGINGAFAYGLLFRPEALTAALLGSMAFAIPVVLLFPRRDGRETRGA